MGAWTEDELRRIGETQELEIAAVRRNGELRSCTPICVVRGGGTRTRVASYESRRSGRLPSHDEWQRSLPQTASRWRRLASYLTRRG